MNRDVAGMYKAFGGGLTAFLALLFVLAGCGGTGGGNGGGGDEAAASSTTYAAVIIPPGDATCPAGGVSIDYGIDDNGNGVLDEAEVDGTATICNGETGAVGTAMLVTVTALTTGDESCPAGGYEVAFGLDNGDGAGTAGDFVLDADEVDGTTSVCNGEPALVPKPIDPPAGPAAQFTIDAHGGDEVPGPEVGPGRGGSVNLAMPASGATGHIKVFATGEADASFDFPVEVSTYLGTKPLLVPTNLTIPACEYFSGEGHVCPTLEGLATGQVHTHTDSSALFVFLSGADDEADTITGIHVSPGATLTFEANDLVLQQALIQLPQDVRNEGTITTSMLDGGPDRAGLDLTFDVYYGSPGSAIDLTGGSVDAGPAGNGGRLTLTGWRILRGGPRYGTGAFFNAGNIATFGGDSSDAAGGGGGGSGGEIVIRANLAFYNTGPVSARGGTCAAGTGGNAGAITFDTLFDDQLHAAIHNAGPLDASGGEGPAGAPGDGNDVRLIAHGHILNGGTINAHGGGTDISDWAGGGGSAELHAYGGRIVNRGDILLYGGAGMPSGAGGGGGSLTLATETSTGWLGENLPAGDIVLSGNIDLSGGNGQWGGGYGGNLGATVDAADAPMGQEIILYGYQQIVLDGGDSSDNGGNAGSFMAYNGASAVTEEGTGSGTDGSGLPIVTTVTITDTGPGGGVYNHVPVSAVGGASSEWYGGNGGSFYLVTNSTMGFAGDWQSVANHAGVTLSGGDGFYQGGGSGHFLLWGYTGAENHGAVTSIGGDASGPDGWGGSPALFLVDGIGKVVAASIDIISDLGPAENTGTLIGDGGMGGLRGEGPPYGGYAHNVEIVGRPATNSGNISLKGGNADTPGEGGIGGDGGTVFIHSLAGSSAVSGSFAISGGVGDAPPGADGAPGAVYVDGMNLTDLYLP